MEISEERKKELLGIACFEVVEVVGGQKKPLSAREEAKPRRTPKIKPLYGAEFNENYLKNSSEQNKIRRHEKSLYLKNHLKSM